MTEDYTSESIVYRGCYAVMIGSCSLVVIGALYLGPLFVVVWFVLIFIPTLAGLLLLYIMKGSLSSQVLFMFLHPSFGAAIQYWYGSREKGPGSVSVNGVEIVSSSPDLDNSWWYLLAVSVGLLALFNLTIYATRRK